MKKVKNIYIGMLSFLFLVTSCQLVEELDDYKPLYSLEAETAITNENTAELALAGVYSAFRQPSSSSGTPELFLLPEHLAGYAQPAFFYANRPEYAGWTLNNPIVSGTRTQIGIYTRMYDLINRCNWLIEKVSALDDSVFETSGRRTEILAEAKILRAMGNFYLLRLFGQFYDINSEYGIALRTSPAKDAEALPRNTVAETYDAILDDLNDGIAGAPYLRSKLYTNQMFAKAYKAKVLLYMGQYAESAALAKDVIDNADANFSLEPDYAGIFDDKDSPVLYESSEVLFGTGGDDDHGVGIGNFQSGFFASVTEQYVSETSGSIVVGPQTIDYDGGRLSSVLNTNYAYGGYWTSKYTSYFSSGQYEMVYHMRMAEVYLVLAEASARAAGSVTTEALNALNDIRVRGGAVTTGGSGFETYPASITYAQFLQAVRMEKLVELVFETGESWYDMIRYDYLDGFGSGFQVSDIKATATDPDKFILPIPQESIDAGGGIVMQNPSYN